MKAELKMRNSFMLNPSFQKPASQLSQVMARILKVFTDIRPDEVRLTLTLFAIVFFMLTAYYVGKPVRESWLAVSVIGDLSKIEIKALSGLLQSITLVALIPIYGKLYDRLPRGKLLVNVNIFFILMFPVFWLLRPGFLMESVPFAGVAFYIWIGIFAVAVIAQFWAFAADLYDEGSGKRLFPLIALGASSGAVIGSMFTNYLVSTVKLNNYTMLLIAPLILAFATFILWSVDKTEEASAEKDSDPSDDTQDDPRSAWRIILGNRYILLIALFIFMLNWIVTNGENILFAAIQDAISKTDMTGLDVQQVKTAVGQATTEFYSRIYFWVNLVGMLLQAFVVSRLLKYGGIAGVLLIPPFVSLASYGTMSASEGLGTLTIAKTAENATNYSVANTARHILWLPVAKEALYKAKTAIDTTVYRSADALAAVTVIIGTRALDISVKGFFILNLFLIIIWFAVAILILRERRGWVGQDKKETHD